MNGSSAAPRCHGSHQTSSACVRPLRPGSFTHASSVSCGLEASSSPAAPPLAPTTCATRVTPCDTTPICLSTWHARADRPRASSSLAPHASQTASRRRLCSPRAPAATRSSFRPSSSSPFRCGRRCAVASPPRCRARRELRNAPGLLTRLPTRLLMGLLMTVHQPTLTQEVERSGGRA